ncbi:MAG: galactonate dehydratase [Desulfocapsaceae bacterium]|nr:galactonate dehydratase [Desulfocapsaceae bacterium]
MKIRSYSTWIVPPRWLFLKIETDSGITGWGEPVIEGKAHTVEAAVLEMMDSLIGKDPSRIEDIWQELFRTAFYRGGPILMSAIAGIDQALWDIKGKYYNAPVYDLLGGRCRDKVRIYQWIGGDRPRDVGIAAKQVKENGGTAVKMNGTEEMQIVDSHRKIDELVERVANIREACGPYFDIGVDFHGRVHKPMARIIAKELEQFNLMFIEEPVLSENLEEMLEIRRHCNIPIAAGERLYSRFDFKRVFESGSVDIIQPDLSHAGGITECRKIAAMAEAYDIAIAPHCPLGPIALAACLQLDAVSYNAFIQEQSLGIHYNQDNDLLDYLKDPDVFSYHDGYVSLSDEPGLGIEINEKKVEKQAAVGHRWRNPVWRHPDGSVAEW